MIQLLSMLLVILSILTGLLAVSTISMVVNNINAKNVFQKVEPNGLYYTLLLIVIVGWTFVSIMKGIVIL